MIGERGSHVGIGGQTASSRGKSQHKGFKEGEHFSKGETREPGVE